MRKAALVGWAGCYSKWPVFLAAEPVAAPSVPRLAGTGYDWSTHCPCGIGGRDTVTHMNVGFCMRLAGILTGYASVLSAR